MSGHYNQAGYCDDTAYEAIKNAGGLTFTIPLSPVTKKNSQRILYKWLNRKKVPFIVQSEAYERYIFLSLCNQINPAVHEAAVEE